MIKPTVPANYDVQTTSRDVEVGDIVLNFGGSASLSGPNLQQIFDKIGLDGGRIRGYVATESGSLSITGGDCDVINLSFQDVYDFSVDVGYSKQQSGIGNISPTLGRGDIFIQWDEDTHGDTRTDYTYSGNYNNLYKIDGSTVSRSVNQATSSGTVKRIRDCCVEYNLISLDLNVISDPTNLSATATNTNTINVDWDSETDPTVFDLHRRRVGGRFSKLKSVSGPSRSTVDDSVSSGVEYEYKIRGSHPKISDSEYSSNTIYPDVYTGDVILVYADRIISTSIDYDVIARDVGDNGGYLTAFLVNEDGQVKLEPDSDLIRTGRAEVESVSDYTVKISSASSSHDTFASDVEQGALIAQWSKLDEGDGADQWSFTGETRDILRRSTGAADRKVDQVFTQGDLSRTSNGAEIFMLELGFDDVATLDSYTSDYSNTDRATPQNPIIDIR